MEKVAKMAMHARKGGNVGGFLPSPRERRKVELWVAEIVVDWRVVRLELVVETSRKCFSMGCDRQKRRR